MMAPIQAVWRHLDVGWHGPAFLVALILSQMLPIPASGQAITGNDGVIYSSQRSFDLPFTVNPADPRIYQVHLYVSENQGKNYRYVASVPPNSRRFLFNAPGDGLYWFSVQTEDQNRQRNPPDMSTAQPGLKVYVDTRQPVVSVRAANLANQPLAIEWDVRDDESGLNFTTLYAAYRPAGVQGAEWVPLPIQQLANGQYAWTPAGNAASYEVRLQVRDKAGNIGEGLVTLPYAGGRAGSFTPSNPASDSMRNGVIFVNKKKIQLNFRIDDVGPSKVKAVDIWYTHGQGTWQKYQTKEASLEPPYTYTIDVEGEGRYGFTLVAVSGVGHAEAPPRAGDQPQVWVEVDLTPPEVHLDRADVGSGIDKGTITIRWRAADKFLAAQPITLSYGTADGQWVTIASNLPNDGHYVWRMPEGLPYQFPIRVEAVDQAGNVGSDKTSKDVIVDLSVPKARVIGVEGVKGVP